MAVSESSRACGRLKSPTVKGATSKALSHRTYMLCLPIRVSSGMVKVPVARPYSSVTAVASAMVSVSECNSAETLTPGRALTVSATTVSQRTCCPGR